MSQPCDGKTPESMGELEIEDRLVSYHSRLARREVATIDTVVIHCTELPTLSEAREYAERVIYPKTGSGACGHYYIDRDGSTYRYVGDDRIAHHVFEHNERSLGIELVNRGRFPRWFAADHQTMSEPYPEVQIETLVELVGDLEARYPGLYRIAAHADLDQRRVPAEDDPAVEVRRRIDPGPLFPWTRVQRTLRLRRLAPEERS